MTTEDGPAGPDGRGLVVRELPARGTVLVQSRAPPEVPADRCVDVRPGAAATFDGDTLEMSLSVLCGTERRRFSRRDLSAVASAVASMLAAAGSAAGTRGPEVVRFGDRSACRAVLPAPSVAAIERRLRSVASRRSGALLTWTSEPARPADYRTYDVVLDGPRRGEG